MNQPSRPDFETLTLGSADGAFDVDTSADVREAVRALAREARRSVDIVTRRLDPAVFDDRPLYDLLREFVLSSRRARLRVIVMNSAALVQRGHRLIDLFQRLSTFIEVRNPGIEHRSYNSAFVVADGLGYVFHQLADRYEAQVDFNGRRRADELLRHFDSMWEAARPDPEIRRLQI